MEKFAVDLDKVLDDFEFNEDCAEQIASINTPSNNASASSTKCNLDGSKNYNYHASNEHQAPSLDARSPAQGRLPVYSNANYLKSDVAQDSTDHINHFYMQDYTGDSKLTQKQAVPPYDTEPASLTIHNDISHRFLQKQQNGSSSPKIDNRYDKKLNQPSAKPSVSNVFNSLNEYINAPTGSLEYVHTMSEDEEDARTGKGTSNIQAATCSSSRNASVNQVCINNEPDKSNVSLPESDVNTSTSVVKKSISNDSQDLKACETLQVTTEPVTDNDEDETSTIGLTSLSSSKKADGQGDLPDFTLSDVSADENIPSELGAKSMEPSVVTLESIPSINAIENAEKDIIKCDTEENTASVDAIVPSKDSVSEKVVPEELSSRPSTLETCTAKSKETIEATEIESVSKGGESPKVEQKKFQFSNFEDHTEEDLMKCLAELEEQDKSNNSVIAIDSDGVEKSEEGAVARQIKFQDEDANEAPIFESVVIGEVPKIPQEDLQEKAKMFPVIDYSKDEKEETAVSNFTEKQSTEDVSKDTEGSVSLQQEKEEEEEESVELKSSESSSVKDETEEKHVALKYETSNEKSTQEHETQSRSVEQATITDVKSNIQLEEKPIEEEIGQGTSDDLKTQEEKDRTKDSEEVQDNTKESSLESSVSEPSDTIEKPNRPQTLDIVVPETTSEPQAIGSSSVTPSGQTQSADIEPPKDDCQGSSPDALDNSLETNSVLGMLPPIWVPDCEAASCMLCYTKFTMIKRRHHCRACGKVLCSTCSNWKHKLEYKGNVESRVCVFCYHVLTKAKRDQQISELSSGYSTYANNNEVNSPQGRQPNPNNPMEYCSTIPPLQQLAGGLPPPPTVMVPVGVLKRVGGTKHRSEGSKSVMFSDGIRPGCDLTELDMTWDVLQPACRKPASKKVSTASFSLVNATPKRANLPRIDPVTECFVPQDPNGLPPTVTIHKGQVSYHAVTDEEVLYRTLKNDCQPPVMFAINRNLYAYVKITNLNCCVNKICWNVTSRGLACVGQDEVILLIETLPDETRIPKDLLVFINQLYVEAMKGNTVSELGFAVYQGGNLLSSREHAGFLFIRQTLQCLQKIVLPPAPFLVGLLVHRWETPWAKVFPLRLLLRLGAEYRYYPCPLVSVRFRDALYFEIGHTVMKVLADFRNYSYTLPGVRGLTIHLRNRMTDVMFPRNRYDQVIKGLNNSNDHVLAYASNFSIAADSHLVCIQTNTGDESNYQTQAINIQNKPRTVTGASFIVINGALKSSMGLSAKSSIVEDGLMVEIMPEKMEALKAALKNMQDFSIGCGRQGAPEPDETVNIKWVDNDEQFNIGVKSPIDGLLMDGVPSIRVHNGTDYKGTSRFIRWTEVFIIKSDDHPNGVHDPVDINKLSGNIAKASCTALVKLLDLLATAGLTKLAVRTSIHPENVGYEAGSEGTKLPPIYMNSLDNELIQMLHKAAQSSQDTYTVLELIFYVLDD